jgi:hypothetical protein
MNYNYLSYKTLEKYHIVMAKSGIELITGNRKV